MNPRDPVTRYELGRLTLKTGEAAQAVEHFKVSAEAKPRDPEMQYWYGRALEGTDDPKLAQDARAAYESAARVLLERPETPAALCDVHYRVGRVHMRAAEDYSLALNDLKRASECEPKRADVWAALGGLHERLWDQQKAHALYTTATKNDREHPDALVGLARGALRANPPRTSEAVSLLSRALKRAPKLAEAHYQLCKAQISSKPKARAACGAYLKLAPDGEFAQDARDILRAL